MENGGFLYFESGNELRIKLCGGWVGAGITQSREKIKKITKHSTQKTVFLDLSDVGAISSVGALAIIWLKKELTGYKKEVKVVSIKPEFLGIFKIVLKNTKEQPYKLTHNDPTFFERVGEAAYSKLSDFLSYSEFLGRLIFTAPKIFTGGNFRFASIVKQIEQSSINALPIVALTAFLIGVVITYQGSLQLERFGAAIFTVDLVGISITRELAPLITAVVIAGRSGASYTSEIGVMKITEEIDAMKTMGFEPFYFLVWPRILALTLTLWLVILFADVVAIFGGMVIANLQLGLSFSEFLGRLQLMLPLKHLFVGLSKAPFFAFLIASIGIFRGLQVRGSSESIGVMTTVSVVNSIFAVIACDALFSVIYSRLGI